MILKGVFGGRGEGQRSTILGDIAENVRFW